MFRTPPVEGVKAGRDYRVELRLREAEGDRVIAVYARSFRSDLDQSILPKEPPVVGPGYRSPPSRAGAVDG